MSALWHLLVVQVSRSSFCCDGTGRRDAACEALLRTAWWFSHRSPTLDHEILMQRQEAVALFIRAPETLSSLSIHMKNVKDVRPAFKRLPGTASCQDWKTILASLEACIALVMNVRQLPRIAELRIFHRMLQLEEIQALTYMRNAIKETIDFQEFETTKEFSVQHGVSPKLDKQVELYAGLEDFLVVVAREEMDSFPGLKASQCSTFHSKDSSSECPMMLTSSHMYRSDTKISSGFLRPQSFATASPHVCASSIN